MTLGEKIKSLRAERMLTQRELAGDKITRNMLSRIESEKANPSLETLRYLADRLDVPIAYLLSEYDNYFDLEKSKLIKRIYEAFRCKNYTYCINLISRLPHGDNELNFILAISYFEEGKSNLFKGSLISAKNNLFYARKFADETVLNTDHIKALIPMYLSVTDNVQSPLLEFDPQTYLNGLNSSFDFEFFKYITQDQTYTFSNELFKKHMRSKALIKEKRYQEALTELQDAVETNSMSTYNAFVAFGLYSDLEKCYKELLDFENAYRYSTKRMSLLEGFKT